MIRMSLLSWGCAAAALVASPASAQWWTERSWYPSQIQALLGMGAPLMPARTVRWGAWEVRFGAALPSANYNAAGDAILIDGFLCRRDGAQDQPCRLVLSVSPKTCYFVVTAGPPGQFNVQCPNDIVFKR